MRSFLSTSTATRSQIANKLSRSWVTMNTVRPRLLLKSRIRIIEFAGRYRIEPGGGLVEKDDFRIEREGAREAGALAHSPRQLRGVLLSGPFGKSDDADLERRDLIHQAQRHVVVFLQRHLDVLRDRQRTEQRAILKQHPPVLFDLPLIVITHRQSIVSENLDIARNRSVEADNGSQQHRFPRPGPADDAENFAAEHVEVETVVDCFGSEPVDESTHADDRLARVIWHDQMCNEEKKIENPASVTITRKIASTTDSVVSRPTLSALRAT